MTAADPLKPGAATPEEHLARLQRVLARSSGAGAQSASPPAAVREKAKLLLLDTIGCMLAGRLAAEMTALEAALAAIESGPFRFPGGRGLSTQSATAIAAIASTWDECCEGLPYAHGRPGLPVVGALLPLAVVRDAPLEEVLRSLIAGYEVGARMGAWLRIKPGMHVDGNWPGLGAAAAVARLLGLTPEQSYTAINIAACQLPASVYLPIKTGDNARNTYIAHTAWLGLLAAFSAAAGISAPREALVHYAQGYAAASSIAAPEPEHYFILDAYFKPHATVRHAHYGIEAAQRIREQLRGDTSGIDAIRLRVYEEAAAYASNSAPQAPIQAQFSLSFGVAAGLRFGALEAEIYRPEHFHDAELRRLEQLVQVEADPELGAGGKRSAVLSVTAGGRRYEVRADKVRGDAESPLSREEMLAKFLRCARGAVADEKARRFASALMDNNDNAGFRTLWAQLS